MIGSTTEVAIAEGVAIRLDICSEMAPCSRGSFCEALVC